MELNVVYNEDCLIGMRQLDGGSVDLAVTSPPYFNAREYSIWDSFASYLSDMREVFSECRRVLKDYSMLVVNVSDVVCSENGRNSSKRKFALGAHFTVMLEEMGFTYIDDIIWDKGEVQSKRNFTGDNFPHQKYPINCYEHILVFRKFSVPSEIPTCPKCHKNIAVSNGINNMTYTYECKNPDCVKSKSGRGVRYSQRQVQKIAKHAPENEIPEDFVRMFRRDIIQMNPVIKIKRNGENTIGHTAPYPVDLAEFAIRFFSGVGDTVLDMFMGSGTTAIAAMNTGRNYIGYELNEEYFGVLTDRIERHKNEIQTEKESE